jgi:hypothetical protein
MDPALSVFWVSCSESAVCIIFWGYYLESFLSKLQNVLLTVFYKGGYGRNHRIQRSCLLCRNPKQPERTRRRTLEKPSFRRRSTKPCRCGRNHSGVSMRRLNPRRFCFRGPDANDIAQHSLHPPQLNAPIDIPAILPVIPIMRRVEDAMMPLSLNHDQRLHIKQLTIWYRQ